MYIYIYMCIYIYIDLERERERYTYTQEPYQAGTGKRVLPLAFYKLMIHITMQRIQTMQITTIILLLLIIIILTVILLLLLLLIIMMTNNTNTYTHNTTYYDIISGGRLCALIGAPWRGGSVLAPSAWGDCLKSICSKRC